MGNSQQGQFKEDIEDRVVIPPPPNRRLTSQILPQVTKKQQICPPKCIMFGLVKQYPNSSVYTQRVGAPVTLHVQFVDLDGFPYCEELLESEFLVKVIGKEEIIPHIEFEKQIATISFVPKRSGRYQIIAKVKNVNIINSPLLLDIENDEILFEKTEFSGTLVTSFPVLQIFTNSTLFVSFFDKYDNYVDRDVFPEGFSIMIDETNHTRFTKFVKTQNSFQFLIQACKIGVCQLTLSYFDRVLFTKKCVILNELDYRSYFYILENHWGEFKVTWNDKQVYLALDSMSLTLWDYWLYIIPQTHWRGTWKFVKMTYDPQKKQLILFDRNTNKTFHLSIVNPELLYALYKYYKSTSRNTLELNAKILNMFSYKNFLDAKKLFRASIVNNIVSPVFVNAWKSFCQVEIEKSLLDAENGNFVTLANVVGDLISLVATNFSTHKALISLIRTSFQSVLKTYKDAYIVLNKWGDGLLKDSSTSEDVLDQFVSIISLCEDRDMCIEYYRLAFTKRLLNHSTDSPLFMMERKMIAKIKISFGVSFVSKFESMIKDKILSKDLSNEFQTKELPIKYEVQIYNNNHFPIVSSEKITPHQELSIYPLIFKEFYNKKFPSRKLQWIYQMGTILASGLWISGSYQIYADPATIFILLNFNSSKELDMNDLAKIHNMNVRRVEHLCRKLLKRKMINLQGSLIILNEDFASNNVKINLKEEISDENQIKKDVSISRTIEIEATIVRLMKSRRMMKHVDLIQETTKQLLVYFRPDPRDIKKRIDDLINREFIARDESQTNVYVYMP